MTEDKVIELGKQYYESLFPRNCPKCQRQFRTLREYLLATTPIGHAHSYDAEIGDWEPLIPVGTAMCSNCRCGTTIVLLTDQMEHSQRLALLDWIRSETRRQSISPTVLLDSLRNKVRQLVLDEQDN